MDSFLVIVILAVVVTVSSSMRQEMADHNNIKHSRNIQLSDKDKRSSSITAEENDPMNCSQDRIIEMITRLSLPCQNYLFKEEIVHDEFEDESSIICENCGSQLYSLLKCLNTNTNDLELYNVLCTHNENGNKCYELINGKGEEESEIISKCRNMNCSDECRASLEESFSRYGCCLYSLVALNTSMIMVHDMWQACGIEEPGMCSPAFNDSSSLDDIIYDDIEATAEPSTTNEPTETPNTDTSPSTTTTTETTETESPDHNLTDEITSDTPAPTTGTEMFTSSTSETTSTTMSMTDETTISTAENTISTAATTVSTTAATTVSTTAATTVSTTTAATDAEPPSADIDAQAGEETKGAAVSTLSISVAANLLIAVLSLF